VSLREKMITAMCHAYYHDFSLSEHKSRRVGRGLGISEQERADLILEMGQLFDLAIAPNLPIKPSTHQGK